MVHKKKNFKDFKNFPYFAPY